MHVFQRAFFIRQLAAMGVYPPLGPVALRRPLSQSVLLTWEEPQLYSADKVRFPKQSPIKNRKAAGNSFARLPVNAINRTQIKAGKHSFGNWLP